MFLVYEIKLGDSGKRYVGRSREFPKRKRSHLNMLRKGEHFNRAVQDAYNAYGEEQILFNTLYTFDDEPSAIEKERVIILEDPETLVNITIPSEGEAAGGNVYSRNPRQEEMRKNLSKAMSGKGNHMYGVPKTDKMINAVKAANSKPLVADFIDYPSMTAAKKGLGRSAYWIKRQISENREGFYYTTDQENAERLSKPPKG